MTWPTAAVLCAVCLMIGLACLATGSAAPVFFVVAGIVCVIAIWAM